MLGLAGQLAERHLVRAPRVFGRLAVDLLRAGPSFRRAEDDHRPARSFVILSGAKDLNLIEHGIERRRHQLMHRHRLVAFHEVRFVAVALEEALQLLARDAREHGGVGDLVAVEVEDGQHGAVARGIEELVRVPARRERAGLRLAVADDAGHDEVAVVERGAVGVRDRVSELASFVNRARRLRRHVARNPARKRELFEQLPHPLGVRRDVRIELAVGALEIRVRHQPRPAVARSGDVDHLEVALGDDAIEVDVDEVQARRRPPVAEEPRLRVLELERLAQQRVVEQVDLADGEVVRGAPVRVHAAEKVVGERRHGRRILAVDFFRAARSPRRLRRPPARRASPGAPLADRGALRDRRRRRGGGVAPVAAAVRAPAAPRGSSRPRRA